MRKWATEYEEAVGTKVFEFVQDWRSQPSPPQQHQYPSLSHSQSQHSQQQSQSHTHANTYNTQQHQLSHRRLSDVRNSGPPFGLNMSNSNPPRPPVHQHAADMSSYGSNTSNHVMKRSPSHSPPVTYPLGRSPNTSVNNNNGSNHNRSLSLNQHTSGVLSDPSASNNGGRDARGQSSVNPALGPSMGHGNCDEPSLTQNQKQVVVGKYRDMNLTSSHSRWPHIGGESIGATTGDGGIQSSYSGPVGSTSGPGVSGGVNGGSMGQISGSNNTAGAVLNGTGAGGGTSGQRNFGLLGEGSQSLPSLKDSGLLESWGSSTRNGGEGQKQTANGPSQQPQSLASSHRTTPPNSGVNLTMSAHLHHPSLDAPDLRPSTTLAMPVGLQWLANESR
ncbi:hypothetical protein GALMADRAFT_1087442 [Galerina marginata CBS 339.88]|uniref:Uncharacterized protein n=1 Tax=Galerina marginata (strain CBS 339.88) TaxID=685588 RepID=A0A067TKT6_GALM3|nr:hypothetical protein GALMADRAFT_1087442 [Galerina marginata CBS 339.88]